MAYIVNHGGVVHSVPDDMVDVHLGVASIPPSPENPAGKPARMATDAEIDAWYASQGLDNPHAKPAKKSAEKSDDDRKQEQK